MSCKVCGAPLQQNARFCPNCGTAIDSPAQENSAGSPPTYNTQQAPPWAPTQPAGPPQRASQQWMPTQGVPTHESQANSPLSPFQPPAPLPYYQNNIAERGAIMPPIANDRQEMRPRRERNRAGCTAGCLTIFVILLLVIGAVWVFLLRPYLHNIAETQIDNALSAGVQQIPTNLPAIPAGIGTIPIPIQDNTINNLFVLNLAPSSPIKNPATQITPSGISMSFQTYGFSNSLSLKPALQNGRLVATNVAINGPFSLIMSPDELTPLLN